MNWNQFLTTNFWFNIDTVLLHRVDKALLVLGLLFVVIGIVSIILSKLSKNPFAKLSWRRLAVISFTVGIMEVLWFGARVQHIRLFGTHAFALFVLIIGFIWFLPLAKYRLTKYSDEVRLAEKNALKQKYLQMVK